MDLHVHADMVTEVHRFEGESTFPHRRREHLGSTGETILSELRICYEMVKLVCVPDSFWCKKISQERVIERAGTLRHIL